MAQPFCAASAALAVSLLTAAAPALADPGVQRRGTGWLIQPQGRSLAELAQALAAASGSRLAGPLEALNQSVRWPGQGRWQVASLDQGWALLLDGRVNHARQCLGQGRSERCTLWLVAAGPGGATPAPAPPPMPPAPAAPRPTADPPGLFPSEAGS